MDEVLKKAMLPEDLFARQTPSLTAEEYFRFMGAIDALSPDDQTPIRLAALEGIAAFSPPIFAAYCSRNVLVCLKRLAQYKPLIGALLYQVEETETEISVEILSGSEMTDSIMGHLPPRFFFSGFFPIQRIEKQAAHRWFYPRKKPKNAAKKKGREPLGVSYFCRTCIHAENLIDFFRAP